MELVRGHDPALHRALVGILGLGGGAQRAPYLLAVHPSRDAQEWAEAFRRQPNVRIRKGRPRGSPAFVDLIVHGLLVRYVREHYDRSDVLASTYDLKKNWRKLAGEHGSMFRRDTEPNFHDLTEDSPRSALLAVRLAAHVMGNRERTIGRRLTTARKRYPHLAQAFRNWRTTGLEMEESR